MKFLFVTCLLLLSLPGKTQTVKDCKFCIKVVGSSLVTYYFDKKSNIKTTAELDQFILKNKAAILKNKITILFSGNDVGLLRAVRKVVEDYTSNYSVTILKPDTKPKKQ